MKTFDSSECRDPPDLIYALVGVGEDDYLGTADLLKPNYNLDVEALFTTITALYLFHKRDVRIPHQIRSKRTMQLSFVPDRRTKNPTEVLGGDEFAVFRAGIGEHGQPAQVGRTSRMTITVLGWYVDDLNSTHRLIFKPAEG